MANVINTLLQEQAINIVTAFLMEQGFTRDKAEFAAKDQVERTPNSLLKKLLAGDAHPMNAYSTLRDAANYIALNASK